MHLNVMAKELLVSYINLDAADTFNCCRKSHGLFAKSVLIPGFAVGGDLNNEHSYSGEQQQMDPASLLRNEQD